MDAEKPQEYSVGEVAKMHGITVRTLHHWEQKGLITPKHDPVSGYRYYHDRDVEKVTAILGYRAIGMSLDTVRTIMNEGARNSVEHLLTQREMLHKKIRCYKHMLQTLDQLLEDAMAPTNERLTAAERAEIMGEAFNPEHEREAQQRYGHTDDWAEYRRRTDSMSRADWAAAKQNLDDVEHALVEAFTQGVKPGSAEANALADRHRASLFYFDVTPAKHVILARGYVEDARFAEHYEKLAEGLAQWLRDIITENARAYGVNPETVTWG